MKTCTICSHPDRSAIDAALVDKTSLRVIAGQYGTNKSALDRHRKHIPTALTVAKQAVEVAEATTLLSRVERLLSRCECLFDEATKDRKWAGAAAAARELRGCLELIGKLSGELQPKGTSLTNVNVFNEQGEFCLEMLTDDELHSLFKRVSGGVSVPETLRKAEIFDEVTIPPFDLGLRRRIEDDERQRDEKAGKRYKWTSGVSSDFEGRFRMLAAAWKRETGEDFPETLSIRDFGDMATIELNFDLTRGYRWPEASLIARGHYEPTKPAKPKSRAGKTIKEIR